MADIWEGDFLNRAEDAAFLIAYLMQRNELAKNQGNRGVSINVDAPWGAGKTFFMTRLASELKHREFRVAYIDAWRDDHAEDPIFAVMAGVLSALGQTRKTGALRKALKNSAGKIAIRAGTGLVQRAVGLAITQTAVEGIGEDFSKAMAEAAEETIGDYAKKALDRFEDGQIAVEDFRKKLTEAAGKDGPLFILIDELDRCRPTYAVGLLERVKHLFDVPNVIFVVATHTGQLVHTIRSVYGADFDGKRYLKRFFDRTYTLDQPSLENFIQQRWRELEFKNEDFHPHHYANPQKWIECVARGANLQLRDIDQCMELLWSLVGMRDPRLHIPLAFLFPAIVAHHLQVDDVFKALFDGTLNLHSRLSEVFGSVPIYTITRRTQWEDRRPTVIDVKISDAVMPFLQILEKGLSHEISSSNSAAEHAELYRRHEFAALHHNRHHPGTKVQSVLENYRSMILSAGKTS